MKTPEEIRQLVQDTFSYGVEDLLNIAIKSTNLSSEEKKWALENLDWKIIQVFNVKSNRWERSFSWILNKIKTEI
jgi:hypothetical protein